MTNRKPTLAVSAIYLNLRHDIAILLNNLSKSFDITIYSPEEIVKAEWYCPSIKYHRLVFPRTLRSAFFNFIYKYFGDLPLDTNSLYLSSYRRIISSKRTSLSKLLLLLDLNLRVKMPRFISYDLLLKLIPKPKFPVITQEYALAITPFTNNSFTSKLLRDVPNAVADVYSWDHPYKFNKFPASVKYLVWSLECKNSLIKQQSLPPANIHVVGSTQICKVHSYISSPFNLDSNQLPLSPKTYLYYTCFSGYADMVKLEIKLISNISRELYKIDQSLSLLVRPYPFNSNTSMYSQLEELPNVLMDIHLLRHSSSNAFSYDDIFKYRLIQDSIAVLHCGTTVGIEALLLKTPSFLLDLAFFSESNSKFIKDIASYQSHILDYIANPFPETVISSYDYFEALFGNLENVYSYSARAINHFSRVFKIQSSDIVSRNIIKHIFASS